LTIHADVAFTATQRAVIQQGVDRLWRDTSGLISLHVVFDFDFSDLASLSERQYQNALLIVHDIDPMVGLMDQKAHAHVRAWTTHGSVKRSFLIAERIDSASFLRDVLHETLHQTGCRDLSDRNALMSLTSNHTVCLTPSDRDELVRVFHVAPESIQTCDGRGKGYQSATSDDDNLPQPTFDHTTY
jgi:hypothetical protein